MVSPEPWHHLTPTLSPHFVAERETAGISFGKAVRG